MKDRGKKLAALLLAAALLAGAAPASALQIRGYSEGLALTTDGVRWGYSDPLGNLVIPVQYDTAVSFSLGLAAVELNTRLGVIRPDGQYLIKPEYGSLYPIGFGLYIAQKGEKWGVVSILTLPSRLGGETQELYPLSYDGYV